MEIMELQADYLLEKINDSIKYYSKSRYVNRSYAFFIKIFVAVLSGTISILAGLNLSDLEISENIINILVLSISALIAVFSTWEAFHQHKELWIKYTEIVLELNNLKNEIEFSIIDKNKLNEDTLQNYLKEYLLIKENASIQWSKLRERSLENQK
jgi:hypothetical protein